MFKLPGRPTVRELFGIPSGQYTLRTVDPLSPTVGEKCITVDITDPNWQKQGTWLNADVKTVPCSYKEQKEAGIPLSNVVWNYNDSKHTLQWNSSYLPEFGGLPQSLPADEKGCLGVTSSNTTDPCGPANNYSNSIEMELGACKPNYLPPGQGGEGYQGTLMTLSPAASSAEGGTIDMGKGGAVVAESGRISCLGRDGSVPPFTERKYGTNLFDFQLMFPTVTDCSKIQNCDEIYGTDCGWCFDTMTANKSNAPGKCNNWAGNWGYCPEVGSDQCSNIKKCVQIGGVPCGWCADTHKGMPGTKEGPTTGTCKNWTFDYLTCGPVPSPTISPAHPVPMSPGSHLTPASPHASPGHSPGNGSSSSKSKTALYVTIAVLAVLLVVAVVLHK